MEKFYIATGKTIDLAIQAALDALHMDRDSVSVEVLENAKSGFLGIGASPAKVKVTYEVPDAPPALSSASRSKPKKQVQPEKKEAKVVELPKAAPKAEPPKPLPVRQSEDRPERPKRNPKPKAEPKPKTEPKPKPAPKQKIDAAPKPKPEYPVAQPGSKEEAIETFLTGLLQHMGSQAVPHAVCKEEDVYHVDLVGENLGMLIGRRGDTLDAIQHLTNYAINRDTQHRVRINVDAESYRAKREESLCRLAHKVAAKVIKYHRSITLEPMNAYERHVIHAALQDTPEVSTFSTGTDPNRRIVVSYNRYRETKDNT